MEAICFVSCLMIGFPPRYLCYYMLAGKKYLEDKKKYLENTKSKQIIHNRISEHQCLCHKDKTIKVFN